MLSSLIFQRILKNCRDSPCFKQTFGPLSSEDFSYILAFERVFSANLLILSSLLFEFLRPPTSVKHTKHKPISQNTHQFAKTQTSIFKHAPKSGNTHQIPKTQTKIENTFIPGFSNHNQVLYESVHDVP